MGLSGWKAGRDASRFLKSSRRPPSSKGLAFGFVVLREACWCAVVECSVIVLDALWMKCDLRHGLKDTLETCLDAVVIAGLLIVTFRSHRNREDTPIDPMAVQY